MRFGLPIRPATAEDLIKARAGFSRGSAGSHKYWKRVRVMRRGKPAWRYYYDTPADRKRWMEDRAKKIGKGKKDLKELEELHRDKADFTADHPDLLSARKRLQELTTEYVTEVLTWDKPPKVRLSEAAMQQYHTAIMDTLGDDSSVEDPHGQPMSVLRTMEMSFERLPPSIKKHFSGAIGELMMAMSEEDAYLSGQGSGAAGYCEWVKKDGEGSRVVIALDRCQRAAAGRGAHMKGGLFPIECLVHEMAHAVHNQIGVAMRGVTVDRDSPSFQNTTWDGPIFKDFEQFMRGEGKTEPGVTGYAETNVYERWAESFTAALMYPAQLADTAPKMYEWFREFFGEDAMHPLHTDAKLVDRLTKERDAARQAGEMSEAQRLQKQIDMATGILDMSADDDRLKWWAPKTTHVQTQLRDYHAVMAERGDPYAEIYDHPEDKFYEMSVGGRSLTFRVGKPNRDTPYGGWEPDRPTGWEGYDPKTDKGRYTGLGVDMLKEIYDEEGRPLDNATAWFHLHQDALTDDHPDAQRLQDFFMGSKDRTTGKASVLDTRRFNKFLQDMSHGRAKDEAGVKRRGAKVGEHQLPVEISRHEFRMRSGRFAYDQWDSPPRGDKGHYAHTGSGWEEFHALRTETDPAKRKALLEAFRKKNPGVEFEQAPGGGLPRVTQADVDAGLYRANQKGQFKKRQVLMRALNPGEQPVPVVSYIRYANTNPDGTSTVISCSKERRGPNRGYYFIDNPVMRSLLTPNGENVESAYHLEELCRQAASERRRAWVSVRADTRGGDTGHYYHIQVEFDGRGQPRIVGDEWARRLGKAEPRLDDLLEDMKGEIETVRPRLGQRSPDGKWKEAERIKLEKAPKAVSGKVRLQRLQRSAREGEVPITLLNVRNNEVGRKHEPPTWRTIALETGEDGNPKARPELPEDKGSKSARLTKRERELKANGQLPEWYRGTTRQREWVNLHLNPAIAKWAPTVERTIPVVLTAVVPAKKAGEKPSPPGWDRMPEGAAAMPENGEKAKRRHPPMPKGIPSIAKLKEQRLLPQSYTGTVEQRAWLLEHFIPAWREWERTLEDVTAKELPARYVFTAIAGSGFPGKTITRWSEKAAADDLRVPFTTQKPKALMHDTLAYAHTKVNPITGKVIEKQIRVLLPRDGSIPTDQLEGVHGVTIDEETDTLTGVTETYIRINLDGFARLREYTGAISLTSEAEAMLRDHVDMLKDAAERQRKQEHAIEIEDLDPGKLARGEVDGFGKVGLQEQVFGNKFELAEHQKELTQLCVDNGGRVLGAHYMGTGKTVSSIVMAKLMMARTDPTDPSKAHPDAPKKVLIVAPLNTVEQWRQAAFDFDEGCHVVGAGSGDIPVDDYLENQNKYGHQLVVVGPEYFTLNQAKLRKAGFDGLIVDEAHMGIKNAQSERNAAINEWNPDMKLLALLTGTPITTSPVDILEYIKILSKGRQWGGMTKETFIEEFLEESPIPGELGIKGKKGPKVQVKPSKRAELAAIIAQWTHVAMQKDVKGKTLPAIRMEESKHAHMTGMQALLYNSLMATLGEGDRAALQAAAGGLAGEEVLSAGAKRKVQQAKAIANCLAYKPKDDQEFITTIRKEADKKGQVTSKEVKWRTLDPDHLLARKDLPPKIRKKLAGRWPSMEELGEHTANLYDLHMRDVLGAPYSELAGTKLTAAQITRMRAAGWPRDVKNPDHGPLGIICRGASTARRDREYLERVGEAMEFQRLFGTLIEEGRYDPVKGKRVDLTQEEAMEVAMGAFGVGYDRAQQLLGTRPDDFVHETHAELGGVRVEAGTKWFSDQRGSLHLLYRAEDWDADNNLPKSRGGFEQVNDGDRVNLPKKYMPKPPVIKAPKGSTKAERERIKAENARVKAEWQPPSFRYDATAGEQDGKVAIRREDTHEVIWAAKKDVKARVMSLMDPGMRDERAKADVAMVVGNAKAEELRDHIQNFHRTTDAGEAADGRHGARQMVMFANGILDGCRTMEATLRTMGFKDVNEALEGSIEYDAEDPHPGNGKYFVTYIGSTYTGSRDLNAEIFKKRKDKLGRDLPESLFVHKTNEGQVWKAYPGAEGHPTIAMSQWTTEAREAIKKQFKITPPEALITIDGEQRYFYGTKKSAQLLRQMALVGDPAKMSAPDAKKAIATIEELQTAYEKEVKNGAVTDPPLSRKQESVFNNCDFIVCSDAAQVGLNFGNAVEMINYDSLGSPMQEAQRITRSARMLPPAVKAELLGKPVMTEATDSNGKVITENGNPVMVPKLDSYGRQIFDGPFGKLKSMEVDIFQPQDRGAPSGLVYGMELNGAPVPGGEIDVDGRTYPNAHTYEAALHRVVEMARTNIATAATPAIRQGWEAIASKSQVALNLGTNQALALFEELQATKVPGGTRNVLSIDGHRQDDPMAGTYATSKDPVTGKVDRLGTVSIAEPEEALRRAIAELSPEDQAKIAKAGFVEPGTDPKDPKGGSLDAVAIYTAIRAQEIMEHIEEQRGAVAERMRSAAGGAVVQDSDVMNAIIDSLSPTDRAILKYKKYLVNVRRMGVSATVGKTVKRSSKNEAGEIEIEEIFTGYERQHPIKPEANVRATARARMTSVEKLLKDIQEKTPIKTPLDYTTVDAGAVSDLSRTHGLAKAIRLVLNLAHLRGERHALV